MKKIILSLLTFLLSVFIIIYDGGYKEMKLTSAIALTVVALVALSDVVTGIYEYRKKK